MSLTTTPLSFGRTWSANTLDALRNSLRLTATRTSCVPQSRAAQIEQPHAGHLDDVHQVVVIEMSMETNAALLHACRGDRDENSRRDVGAVSTQPGGASRHQEQKQNRQRRSIVIYDEAELVVAEHPRRVDRQLERCCADQPAPI